MEGGEVCCCEAPSHVVYVQVLIVAEVRQVVGHICQSLQDVVGYCKQEVRGQQPCKAEHTVPHWQRNSKVPENQQRQRWAPECNTGTPHRALREQARQLSSHLRYSLESVFSGLPEHDEDK